MAMQKERELFIHELGDILDAEKRLVTILPQLAQEVQRTEIQDVLNQHVAETQQHVRNVEQCFQIIGEEPKRTTCFVIEGLKREHDTFMNEQPDATILMMFNLGAAAKSEHYEIASYQMLIELAKLLEESECVTLLQQNLKQEEAMSQKIMRATHDLAPQKRH